MKRFILTLILALAIPCSAVWAQVSLRDTTFSWQHHSFVLNDDHSIRSHSTNDGDLDTVTFTRAKVIENELVKLVLLPEYGGRVLSFIYKPTGYEYFYQSECGSAYQINSGIFYYDWLMVYGGIFPTFPEPEHGKTWLLPWDFTVLKNSEDTVRIRMQYTDSTSYSRAPGSYNNGTTQMTCQVDVSVYKGSSLWDFDVKLINNKNEEVRYEYWTCTTLAPGSTIGNTGTPLNSEIVIPSEKYFAGWSPGSWIGRVNGIYDLDDIDYLSEWRDMGIAYADDFTGTYWGVLNHDNDEGVFRISENTETPGLKLWTWGRDNIDNNMFNFSNGGTDNYIELWAGVSEAFFRDARMPANGSAEWKESYCATTNMSSICDMNNHGVVNLIWDPEKLELSYELNTFHTDSTYTIELGIKQESYQSLSSEQLTHSATGQQKSITVEETDIPEGLYSVHCKLLSADNEEVLTCTQEVNNTTTGEGQLDMAAIDRIVFKRLDQRKIRAMLPEVNQYSAMVYTLGGQLINSFQFTADSVEIEFPAAGMYVLVIHDGIRASTEKVLVR